MWTMRRSLLYSDSPMPRNVLLSSFDDVGCDSCLMRSCCSSLSSLVVEGAVIVGSGAGVAWVVATGAAGG